MQFTKPNKSEAIYGFLGGLFVAVVAAVISLLPWFWPNLDADDRLQESIETGFERFAEEEDLNRQLGYLDQIDRDLKRSWAVGRMELSKEYRSDIENELERRRFANELRAAEIAAQEAKREEIRLAEIAATEAEERARIEAEKQALLAAEQARIAEEQRLAEEQRQREAELERQRLEQERRLEEQRREAAIQAERAWQAERICQNRNCTSWILP